MTSKEKYLDLIDDIRRRKPKRNQSNGKPSTKISDTTIEKATPEQFISGIKNYIQILECKNEKLKEILKENEYTIEQLKLILSSSALEGIKDE